MKGGNPQSDSPNRTVIELSVSECGSTIDDKNLNSETPAKLKDKKISQ